MKGDIFMVFHIVLDYFLMEQAQYVPAESKQK